MLRFGTIVSVVSLLALLPGACAGVHPEPTSIPRTTAPQPTEALTTPAPEPVAEETPAVEETTPAGGASALPAAAPDPLPEAVSANLSQYLQGLVYQEGEDPAARAPGLVLLVDTPDGRFLEAAGVSNLEEGTPLDAGDVFEIGSITKSFVVVLLLQLLVLLALIS